MKKLLDTDSAAYGWVQKGQGVEHWCKAFFSTDPKYDILINNHSEVFNAFIWEVMDKLIIALMEKIRKLMINRVIKSKEKMASHPGPLCPIIQQNVKQLVKDSANYICKWNGGSDYQVSSGPRTQFTVNLNEGTCPCRYIDYNIVINIAHNIVIAEGGN